MNLSDDVATDIDKIVQAYNPLVSPHRVMLVALRLGLDRLLEEPSRLITTLRERAATT